MAIDKRTTRLGVLALVSMLLIGAVGTRLWFLQGVEAASFQEKVSAAKIRTVLIPPERGRIFDAKGRIMADNKRILTVAIDWSVIRNRKARDTMFNRLSGPLKVPVIDLQRRYEPCFEQPTIPKCTKGQRYSTLLPLPLKEDVDEDTVTYLKERSEDFPGIEIVEQWKRVYPYSPLASHVVGYLGPITAETVKQYKEKGYNTNELVGAFGVELSMEDALHGQWGKEVFEVDAAGGIVRELTDEHVDPVAGRDVQLTIDLDVQQYAEQALETKLKQRRSLPTDLALARCRCTQPDRSEEPRWGAGLLELQRVRHPGVDPVQGARWRRRGRGRLQRPDRGDGQLSTISTTAGWGRSPATSSISCSVTRSTRSPARLIPTSRCWSTAPCRASTTWGRRSSRSSPGRRCTAGSSGRTNRTSTRASTSSSRYPTTFAPAVFVACSRTPATFAPTGRPSTAPVTVADALAVSSDAFFYRLGEKFWEIDEHNASVDPTLKGKSTLKDDLQRFGFGTESGIQLPFEWSGRIPDDAVKKELVDKHVLGKNEEPRLLVGDNVQVAIGQGLMAATPLQMANAYSTIANGGFLRQPTIVKNIFEPLVPDLGPGMADLSKAVVYQSFDAHTYKDQLEMPPDIRDPIVNGLKRVINADRVREPGVTVPEELLPHDHRREALRELSDERPADRRQDRHRPGRQQLSVERLVDLRRVQPRRCQAVHGRRLLEKSGYGAKAAAPVVKCIFTALGNPLLMDPVLPSDQLDLNSLVPAPPTQLRDSSCMPAAVDARD